MRSFFVISILLIFLFCSNCLSADQMQSSSLRIFLPVPPIERNKPIIDWLKKSKWCWGIEVESDISQQAIQNLCSDGFKVVLYLNANKDTLIRDYQHRKKPVPDINETVNKYITAVGGAENAFWEMLLENDSAGVANPYTVLKEKPKTNEQAKQLFDKHILDALENTKKFPSVKKWGLCGYASGANPYARMGVDCMILERANDDVEDLQTGIAFTRGAARQYDRQWGIDLSLWWGVIYGCIQDLPASYFTRQMFVSYFSGARTFRIEGGDLFLNEQTGKFYQLKDAVDSFGKFAINFDPGTADIPIAVILPADSGWITPAYWKTGNDAWNYARIPYRQGERTIDSFFAAVFPGSTFAMQPFPFGKYEIEDPAASPFALSCISPIYAPSPSDAYDAEPYIPFGRFHDRNQARETLHKNNIDTSPYRPMGTSRYGDIFDCFTDDVTIKTLSNYSIVVIIGPVKIDDARKAMLLDYVKHGGNLVWASGVVTPELTDITGISLIPELRVATAYKYLNENPSAGSFAYLPAKIANSKQTQIVASTPSGQPLIVKMAVGKGNIYTCTIPWFQAENGQLAEPVLKLFDQLFGQYQPVSIEGLPLEWISTTKNGCRSILLANNNSDSWKGTIIVNNLDKKLKKCFDMLSGKELKFHRKGNKAQIKMEIAPYGLGILQWR